MSSRVDVVIRPGKTFKETFLYASDEKLYLDIQSISSLNPLRLIVPSHNLPGDAWVVELKSDNPSCGFGSGFFAKTIDEDTIEVDAPPPVVQWLKTNSRSCVLSYQEPLDLSGWVFRGQARESIDGALVFSWHSDPEVDADGQIEIGESRITLKISPIKTAELSVAFTKAVYDIEAVSPSGEVLPVIDVSSILIERDVTSWPTE